MQTPANFLLPVSMAAHTFPGWTNCPCIFFFLFIFVPSQTGGFIGFLLAAFDWLLLGWTEMTGCPFWLEHDLGLATLSLASHWSFGRLLNTCMRICVCGRGSVDLWCGARKLEVQRYSQIVLTIFGKWHFRANSWSRMRPQNSSFLFLPNSKMWSSYATSLWFYKPQNKLRHRMQTFFYSLTEWIVITLLLVP